MHSSDAGAPPVLSQRQAAAAIAFSALGWAFDLFDLFILLYVAPVLAVVFFPSERQMLSLAAVYAAFTATLVMRPAGGWLFGRYADRHGRKRAMVVAAVGVGLATALMGLLPDVRQVGLLAPLLFLALRLVQGVFMGGMVASTHTLGTESIGPAHRGLASGIISGGGSGVGKLLASLVFLLVSSWLPGPLFAEWGWRLMFLSGLLSSLLGLLVFTRLQESPLWQAAQRDAAVRRGEPSSEPLKSAAPAGLRDYLPELLLGTLLSTAGGGLSYLTSGYLPTFLKLVDHVPHQALGEMLSAAALAVIGASVLSGWLSDRLGRKPAMLLVGALSLVGVPLLYQALQQAGSLPWIGLWVVLLSALGTLCYAPLLIVLNERFPTAIRSRGTAVAWNIGFALGGSMPVLVSLGSRSSSALADTLGVFCAALAALYLLAAWRTPTGRNLMS